MDDSQAEAAIEVTDVDSAAQEIERRFDESEAPEIEEEAEISAEPDVEEETDEPTPEELDEEVEQEPESEEIEAFNNIDEIAEALDMPIEDFMSTIKVKRKINGVEEEVSMSEMLSGNQRDTDYRQKTMALAEKQKQFDAEQTKFKAQYQQQLNESSNMAQMLENQMLQQYQAIDWNELEQTDSHEWLVMRQKFQEDYQKVQTIKSQAQGQMKQQSELQKQQQGKLRQDYLAKETDLMLSAIPDWANPDTRASETQQMTDFLTNEYGFNESDVASVTDHRLVNLVRDAMLSKGNKAQADIATKRVKRLPKIVKPSAKLAKSSIAKQKSRDQLGRYKKTNSTDDLANYLLDRM